MLCWTMSLTQQWSVLCNERGFSGSSHIIQQAPGRTETVMHGLSPAQPVQSRSIIWYQAGIVSEETLSASQRWQLCHSQALFVELMPCVA